MAICPDCKGDGVVEDPELGRDLDCIRCDGEGEWCPDCGEPLSFCDCDDDYDDV